MAISAFANNSHMCMSHNIQNKESFDYHQEINLCSHNEQNY
jgi:hypothetical protein